MLRRFSSVLSTLAVISSSLSLGSLFLCLICPLLSQPFAPSQVIPLLTLLKPLILPSILSRAIDSLLHDKLLSSAAGPRFRALSLSSSIPHSGDWLLVLPSHSLGLHFLDLEFRTIILGDSHWICVEIINKCEVLVMDSLSSSLDLNDDTLIQIASLLKSERPSISMKKISTQQQSGFFDCGLFAIAYSLEACLGTTRTVKQKFDQKMCHHLINCLENNLLTPFPKTKGNVLYSLEEGMKLHVYCVCQLPDIYDEEMILCDVCSKWFHKRCVAVIDAHLEWICPNCHK